MPESLPRAAVPFAVALALAIGNWLARARHRRRVEAALKAGTMVAIIAAAWTLTKGRHDAWQARFFLPGLALCLIGDVLLMLEGRGFLAGLAAFLAGHVCYIVGLTPSVPDPAALVFVIAAAAIAVPTYRLVARGLHRTGQESLLAPVGIYVAVIGLMLSAAWATLLRPEWSAWRRGLVIAGASLFCLSDSLLARDRFVRPSRWAPVAVMVTYHLAQMALAASISLAR